MPPFHQGRHSAFLTRGCRVRPGHFLAMIVVLLCAPVLIRTAQPLDPENPVKPKPSVVRVLKATERPITKVGHVETWLSAPGVDVVEPPVQVFVRYWRAALVVGPQVGARSQALRAPPV